MNETPTRNAIEYGIEYTGVNSGKRLTEWYYGPDTLDGSKAEADYQLRRYRSRGMKPEIVHRYVTPTVKGEPA